jgi:hypothetical protein
MTSQPKIGFVMASHGRLLIVEQNIRHLLQMGMVFLTVSDDSDYDFLIRKFHPMNEPNCYIHKVENQPLGNKWQCAVEAAQKYPDILITCGSDDFLSVDYVENAIKLIDKGFDFVGVNGWHLSDGKRHYKANYKHRTDFPAGSGRVFTKKCLNAIDWDLFDRNADRLLDDKALFKLKGKNIKTYISQDSEIDGLRILALKGGWSVMNPLNKFLSSPTIKIERIKNLPVEFPNIKI